jgi:6-pyruvoyltetrahydropterin/6-carboxytetrahydropterin synthase
MINITRRIEFDAGHRIPSHESKCRNAHGHRYVLEATIVAELQKYGPAEGMVMDFGTLKDIMTNAVGEAWDHAFLVYEKDIPMRAALNCLGHEHKTVILDRVPTVENLVALAAELIIGEYAHGGPGNDSVVLTHVRLYETPNCWADWYPQENKE